MIDPTGSSPTSEPEPPDSADGAHEPLQPEDFVPRRRSLYAVPLWTRRAPDTDVAAPARPAAWLVLAYVGAVALAAWIVLAAWMPGTPVAPPRDPATRFPPRAAWTAPPPAAKPAPGETARPPEYRRLTDEELRSQLPPGAVLVE